MKKLSAAAGVLVVAGLAVAGVLTLGGFSLLSTRGTSMQPEFQAGDLAVLRPTSELAVGDVAAYRSSTLRTLVMHRVTAIEGQRFTFQGDNNSWIDPEHPGVEDIVGSLALRIPQGGAWLDRLTGRNSMALLVLFLVLGGGTATTITRRQQKRQQGGATVSPTVTRSVLALPAPVRGAAAAALAVALGAGGLAVVAWGRPAEEPGQPAQGPAAMTYSYLAMVPPSAAYDATTVIEPQPIFRKLANTVHVTFAYDSVAGAPENDIRVNAELSNAEGWRSTVPLRASGAFVGARYVGHVVLDLDELQARADAAARAIGAGAGSDVAVTVVAEVRNGNNPSFRPQLPFVLNPVALRLAQGGNTPLTVEHETAGSPHSAGTSTALSLLGRTIPLQQARTAAASGLILAVLALLGLGLWVRRAVHAPAHVGIQQQYAPLLMAVEPVVLPPGRPVIDVPDIDGLARLAQRYGLLVMHWHRGGVHTYVVFEEHMTYRYRYAEPPTQIEGQPEADPRAVAALPLENDSDVPASDAAGSC